MADPAYDLWKRLDTTSGEVVVIEMFGDYECPLRTRMRNNFQLESWRRQWREAQAAGDHERLDYLDRLYDCIGLP